MRIYVLNTLQVGLNNIDEFRRDLHLSGIIGLSERSPGDSISDYLYQEAYCKEHGLDFFALNSYSMDHPEDIALLRSLDIDVLIVAGWQRLLPDWLIKQCKVCVIGAHGSPLGISEGRGRSPMNWTLLFGWKEFSVSIFKIDAGIDSGDIIDTAVMEISEFDDIQTAYYKISLTVSNLIIRAIRSGKLLEGAFTKQAEGGTYLPMRKPEDGIIDWGGDTKMVYDQVRALTRPYPGAFGMAGDNRVMVWKGIPFSVPGMGEYAPGEIVKIFQKGELLVRTGDGFFLVTEHSSETPLKTGMRFSFQPAEKTMQGIRERHYAKYPDLKLNERILNYHSVN